MALLKDISADGKARVPSAYELKDIVITNADGKAVNVNPLVVELSLTESIYSPSVICKLSLKDEANVFGILPIYGLETIQVRIGRTEGGKSDKGYQEIDLVFYVTETPLYGRPNKQHTQVWTITAISEEIWHAQFCTYCYPTDNMTSGKLAKLLVKSLNIDAKGGFQGVPLGKNVATLKPLLQQLNWLLTRSGATPAYFFQQLNGDYYLTAHSSLTKGGVYKTYTHSKDYNVVPGTEEDYDARKFRMLEVSSALDLSKFTPGADGTWCSEQNHMNVTNRDMGRGYVKYTPTGTLENGSVLQPPSNNPDGVSDNNLPDGQNPPTPIKNKFADKLTAWPYASTQWYHPLSGFTSGHKTGQKQRSNENVASTFVHDVKVFGDFDLNAGKVVELKFPAAVEPSVGQTELYDLNLSGKHLLTSVTHRFKNQEYYCEFRAKRDSFT